MLRCGRGHLLYLLVGEVLGWPRDESDRCVGYLTKYLTKQISGCHAADTDGQRAHAARLADALTYEPCSPTCANWLRYGVQPRNARPHHMPPVQRLLHVLRDRAAWKGALTEARRRAQEHATDVSAAGRAA